MMGSSSCVGRLLSSGVLKVCCQFSPLNRAPSFPVCSSSFSSVLRSPATSQIISLLRLHCVSVYVYSLGLESLLSLEVQQTIFELRFLNFYSTDSADLALKGRILSRDPIAFSERYHVLRTLYTFFAHSILSVL